MDAGWVSQGCKEQRPTADWTRSETPHTARLPLSRTVFPFFFFFFFFVSLFSFSSSCIHSFNSIQFNSYNRPHIALLSLSLSSLALALSQPNSPSCSVPQRSVVVPSLLHLPKLSFSAPQNKTPWKAFLPLTLSSSRTTTSVNGTRVSRTLTTPRCSMSI